MPVGLLAGSLFLVSASPFLNAGEELKLELRAGVTVGSSLPKIVVPESGSPPFWAYAGITDATGEELYRIDPSTGVSQLIADLNPGAGSSDVKPLAWAGGRLYFSSTGALGRELWMTQGTAATTQLVADITPGSASSTFEFFSALGSTLVFTVRNSSDGTEVYAKTPTVDGATRLTYFPGTSDSSKCELFSTGTGSAVFFYGPELWRTDGTIAGTGPIKTLVTGAVSSIGGRLLLQDGGTLWLSTTLVVDNQTISQVWKTDGTAAGTTLVMDNPARGPAGPLQVTAAYRYGTKVYLFVQDSVGARTELWTTGGSPATTLYLTSLLAYADPGRPQFFELGGQAWIYAYRSSSDPAQSAAVLRPAELAPVVTGTENQGGLQRAVVTPTRAFVRISGKLWATDGTATGTVVVDESPFISDLVLHRGTLCYISGTGSNLTLWKVDPATLVREALRTAPGNAALPTYLGTVGTFACWLVNDAAVGLEVVATDTTPAGTFLVRDFVPGAAHSELALIGKIGDSLLFRPATAPASLAFLASSRFPYIQETFSTAGGPWTAVSGNWILQGGALNLTGNVANAIAVASGPIVPPQTPGAAPVAPIFGDFRLSATLTAADDDAMGFVFGYQNAQNYHRLVLVEQTFSAPFNRGVTLERVVNGVAVPLGFAPVGYTLGRAIQVELTSTNQVIDVRVDGLAPFASVPSPAPVSGQVGFYGNWQNGLRVDDVAVESPVAPSTTFWREFEQPDNPAALGAYVVQPSTIASEALALTWPNNGTNRINEAATTTLPPLRYSIRLAQPASLDLWIRGSCTTGFDDSFFYRVDGGAWVRRNLPLNGGIYTWHRVTGLVNLAAGEHVIEVLPREDGGLFDALFLGPPAVQPTGL